MRSKFVAIAIMEFKSYATIGYIPKRLWLLLVALVRLDLSLAVMTKALLSRGGTKTANLAFTSLYLYRHGSPPYSISEAFNLTAGHELSLAASS
jgi:hypothetical protein